MNEFQQEIYKTIDILTKQKLKQLGYDKTKRGKVVSVSTSGTDCMVEIDGENYNCKLRRGIYVESGDIVFVKFPLDSSVDKYVDTILGGNDTPVNVVISAGEVLDKLLTVDGSGSGLDADLLDGKQGSYYATQTDLATKVSIVDGKQLSTEDYTTTEKSKLSGIEDGANNYIHPTTHNLDMITETIDKKIMTSDERDKLTNVENGAEANNISDINAIDLTDGGDTSLHYHSTDRDRSNHTGTQLSNTISDFKNAVKGTVLDGLLTTTNTVINVTDTVLGALGKLQAQINNQLITLANHMGNKSNPHEVTKSDINLDKVENKSSETIRSEITSSNVTTALGYIPLDSTLKGSSSGLAELDSSGKVPASQLPSYVDDVLEYPTLSELPLVGESGKIYIAQDTNKTYRWSGTDYVVISETLALGETSATAYRGDRGKVAYDHSQILHDKNLVGLENVTNESKATMFDSPTFTGTPIAPTAIIGTNTSQIATTEFVQSSMSGAGLGDMLKSVYDQNDDGIVDNAEKVNGFTVESNVPSDAIFIDTTYDIATTSTDGLMSSTDKIFLENITSTVGDMKKSIYDTDEDGKVDLAEHADTATSANYANEAGAASDANTVNGYTVESDVPSGAKFTDTVYTHPNTHPYSMITGTPTSLPANGGNADTVDGVHADGFSRSYHADVPNINSTYTTIAKVTGGGLNSKVRFQMGGTTGSVVVAVIADILASHSGNITVDSISSNYTEVTLKIQSDGNSSFYILAKTNSANLGTMRCSVTTFGHNESVTMYTTNPTPVGTTILEHVCYKGSRHLSNRGQITTANMYLNNQQVFHSGKVNTFLNNTSYTAAQGRNIILSTANPSGGGNGDVWIKYTA